jgi:hypothetical protein
MTDMTPYENPAWFASDDDDDDIDDSLSPEEYAAPITIDFGVINAPRVLLSEINRLHDKQGWESFVLHVGDQDPLNPLVFPNICVPIAAIIDYFRNRGLDIECAWADDRTFLAKSHTHDPYVTADFAGSPCIKDPFNKVWRFSSSDDINLLVDSSIRELQEKDVVGEGFISGIEWCLNEAMDNVLQHSEADSGFFMGLISPIRKRFSICIFDNGIGIYRSLKGSRHAPNDPSEAISLALQEKVTRDANIGQGNGMWGLSEIIKSNDGRFRVSTGGATYEYVDGKTIPMKERGGLQYSLDNLGTTLIDFHLDYSRGINVAEALGHTPVPLWLENRMTKEGEYLITLSKESEGTGTRRAGERMRRLAINTLKEGKSKVVFDLEGVSIVSSSYADELFGKLVAELGFSFFINSFSLINVSTINSQVIDRSVQQRMAQRYYDPTIEDSPDPS